MMHPGGGGRLVMRWSTISLLLLATVATLPVLRVLPTAAATMVLSGQSPIETAIRGLLSFRFLQMAGALSEYKQNVPNGRDVSNKYFGHTANKNDGGNPDLGGEHFGHNGYGRDYCAYDYVWSLNLCAADSGKYGRSPTSPGCH